MSTFSNIIARGNAVLSTRDFDFGESDTVMNLLIAFLGIAFFGLLLVALLIILRRVRQQRTMQETLPQNEDVKHRGGNHHPHRLTIQTNGGRSSFMVVDGRPMLANPHSPPHSPDNIPEIHITFPDEHDEYGHKQHGRVVVVRVGENGVGLEPLHEEQLPAYEKESKHQFYSIDMDQIGGLKEKNQSRYN